MSDRLIILNNVFIPFNPPGWLDGIDGFWWNLHQLLPWIPNSPSEWQLFFIIWAPLQIIAFMRLHLKTRSPA